MLASVVNSRGASAPSEFSTRFQSTSDQETAQNSNYAGFLIDSIEIENRNIYDLQDERYDGFLFRTANRFHVVTRRYVVERELLFRKGDPFSPELAAETARNLRTRLPFKDAWVEVQETEPGRALVRVITIDQWSLIGGVRSIDTDGGETNLRIGFEERNLLGNAQFISCDYYFKEFYPDYVITSFREPRLLSRPLAVSLDYRSDPYNTLKHFGIGRPYYSLAQSFSMQLDINDQKVRQRRYDAAGNLVAQWLGSSDQVEFAAGVRHGPTHQKASVSGGYKYFSSRISDVRLAESDSSGDGLPVDSLFHELSVSADYRILDFIVERRIQGFGFTEDYTLGWGIRGFYGRALTPDFNDHYYDRVGGDLSWSDKFGSNLVLVGYAHSYWFKRHEEIRRAWVLEGLWYNNRLPWLTLAARSRYESDQGGHFSRLVLGGKSGIRGYPTEQSAGDRMHVINLEGRFFTGLELLSVKIGSALFCDLGRTWVPGEKLSLDGYFVSAGAGLRFSLENLLRGEIIRADVIRTEFGDWEISFGTGQYF
jgi:outer membrane protein assembly factor BamA